MKSPPRFHVSIMGDTLSVLQRENISPGVGRLLAELLSGRDVPLESFRSWGLQVTVEADSDQGDDG